MRALRFLNLMILSTLVGCSVLAFAQDEKRQDDKPAQQEEAKPQPKQDEAKPMHQDEAKPSKDEKQEMKQDPKRDEQMSHDKAMPEKQDHAAAMQGNNAHPAGKGGHIPDDKFKAHFGHGHTFRAQTVIVAGQPQFQYGGYNFELVDGWPAGWAYTDDCYIDYIDGEYFLFDLLHPGVRIAVFVVL
jgi:hypothetical protein